MFRKVRRYVTNDVSSDEKDISISIASLLYDVARFHGLEVLQNGKVFAVYWWEEAGKGLDISFGSPSPRQRTADARTVAVSIKEELNKLFRPSIIEELKSNWKPFIDACTFSALYGFNRDRRKNLNQRYELFEIPRLQPLVEGYSQAFRNGSESEKVRLITETKRGEKPHIYMQTALTTGKAKRIESEFGGEDFDYLVATGGMFR
ncbi:hypothetical protein [Roseovarius sp. A46]|uniref:hypothetical protein n=1 Tax=Roseovarius sp. A46 TaxID=2109331 RepID=UPI0010102266|nr:hypothetical protein [Roseovarius sp. A46]